MIACRAPLRAAGAVAVAAAAVAGWAGVASAAAPAGRIAYLGLADGTWQAWVGDAAGGDGVQVTRSAGDKLSVSWTPDATRLLVTAQGGRLLWVDVATQRETPLVLPVPEAYDAAVSPSGDRIAFAYTPAGSRDHHAIWTVDARGGGLHRLTNMPGIQHQPAWSADGGWIYFAAGDGGQSHDLWRVAADGSTRKQLTVGDLYHFDPAVGPDGSLAYSSNRTGDYEIWVQPSDGKPRQLTHEPGIDAGPTWSPDGKWIAFESARGGQVDLWLVPAAGGAPQRLTHSHGGARHPAWGPAAGRGTP